MTIDDLARLLAPLYRRVSTMVSRVVLRAVDDTQDRQSVQVEGFKGELHPEVEHFQPFGVRGRPPIGVDGIGIAVGGERNHLVVFGLGPTIPPAAALGEGDVAYYGVDPKTFYLLKASGEAIGQGRVSLKLTLDGLGEKQFVLLTPGRTVLQVESDDGQKSSVTITPSSVVIETPSFVHP